MAPVVAVRADIRLNDTSTLPARHRRKVRHRKGPTLHTGPAAGVEQMHDSRFHGEADLIFSRRFPVHAGSDRGRPNQGSTLFSKRVSAQIRSPASVST
jgi:hypothetical protein